jgi:NTP pyrophosphatase (non-canonical NTP hydrolase)
MIRGNLNDLANAVHDANRRWWQDPATGKDIDRNFGEMIALCHSELSEALEGHRKDLQDDKLPHRKMIEVELADCVIRILDICAGLGLDLQGAFDEKMAYNAVRSDHRPENRVLPGGKKY